MGVGTENKTLSKTQENKTEGKGNAHDFFFFVRSGVMSHFYCVGVRRTKTQEIQRHNL